MNNENRITEKLIKRKGYLSNKVRKVNHLYVAKGATVYGRFIGEGNQGDGKDLGRHQVYCKGPTDVEGACCYSTCHLDVKSMGDIEKGYRTFFVTMEYKRARF